MATIGALVAELSANTASFHRDMGKAVQHLNSSAAHMNRSLASIERGFRGLGMMVARIAGPLAMGLWIKSQIDAGDATAKFSEKTGLSVELISQMQFAAKLANVDLTQMATLFPRLAANMQDAAINRGGAAAAQFGALGVAVQNSDGTLRALDGVLLDVAARFETMPNGAQKSAAAVKLFGKSGAEAIPFLNELRAGLEEARRNGIGMSTEYAKAAERVNDTFTRLQSGFESFVASKESTTAFLDGIVYLLKGAASSAAWVAANFESIGMGLGAIGAASAALLSGNLAQARGILQLYDQDVEEINRRLQKTYAQIWGEGPQKKPGAFSNLPLPEGETSKKLENLLHALKQSTALLEAGITDDVRRQAQARLDMARQEWHQRIADAKLGTGDLRQVMEAYNEWNATAMAKFFHDIRTPVQILADEWQDTMKQMQNAERGWLDDMSQGLTDFVMTGKFKFKDFANSIIRDLVRIQIQKALAGIFGERGLIGTLGTLFGGGGAGAAAIGGNAVGGNIAFAAAGGPVSGGSPYIVGERGPELFVPGTSGTIVPNRELGGARGGTFYIDARGADAAGLARLERLIAALDGSIEPRAMAAVANEVQRGGRYAAAFQA